MTISLVFSAGGALGEFVGFAILAFELLKSNERAIGVLSALQKLEDSAFGSIQIGPSGSRIEGGILGGMIANIKADLHSAKGSRRIIWIGVIMTAVGSLLQLCGQFIPIYYN